MCLLGCTIVSSSLNSKYDTKYTVFDSFYYKCNKKLTYLPHPNNNNNNKKFQGFFDKQIVMIWSAHGLRNGPPESIP